MKFAPVVAAAVAAVAVTAAPAAGAGLPDLRPASVSSPAVEVTQGTALDVKAVVRNRGAGRAKASAVGWWLSRDGRARDVRLGTAPAKALGTGRRHRVATRLRVTAAPGQYHLVACADAGRRVGERSERNNCMPARGSVRVVAGTPARAPLPPVGDPTPPAPPAPPAPPKPELQIPPLDPGAATSLADSVAFLHSGANPVQPGVAPGTIRERRAAALRGTVTNRAGAPLPGVRITVVGHPEYGRTDTQADGGFQLVVNGGDAVTIAFAKAGYADVQRTVETPWEDWVIVDSVVMIPLDPSVTRIVRDSDEPFQVARATPSRDADGSRRATLLFPRGVAATMRMPDGERRPLGDLSVRATEYTVGNAGDAAMPGTLPPSSGYTYAAAFTVDEAERAGAVSVEFDKPVLSYTENFIGAEVGSAVPAGYYDPRRTAWVPAPNGRVIEVVSEADGVATLDGAAGLDISDDERRVLARLYEPGQQLWRVPLEHFTPWDLNWPYGPPPGAMPPLPWFNGEAPDPCEETGSIIGCETQTLGERVPVTGTPFDLVYSSDRQPGWRAGERIRIPITAGEMPDRLKGVQLTIDIAGRRFEQRWEDPTNPIQGQTALPDLEPNLSYTFTWDGKDAFGRPVQGSPIATIRVLNVYDFVYYPSKSGVASSFGQFPDDMEYFDGRRSCGNQRPSFVRGVAAIAGGGGLAVQDPATDPHFFCGVPVARTVKRSIGAWNAAGVGLGGWTLSVHHAYDPVERRLHKGDGSTASTVATGFASRLIAGGGGAWPDAQPDPFPATGADLDSLVEAALGPDGSIYVTSGPCSNGGHGGVRRITPDGMISQFAGKPQCGEPTGDGGPARDAVLGYTLRGLDVGPDGSVYLSVVGTVFPNGYIRKIAPDGRISTLAGVRCACGPMGDGGPAVAARVTDPVDVKVGSDGSVYFGERPGPVNGNKARIRRIDPTGVIQTIAGGGIDANPDEDLGDGEPATDHNLAMPYSLAFGPDGSLYVAHPTKHIVTRIGTDGRITRVAGDDQQGTNGPDGRPALETALGNPTNVAVDSAGALFIRTDDFGDGSESLIRKLLPDGTITTVAGRREGGCSFTLSPPSESATYACIERTSRALEVAPNGSIVYTDGRYQLRRLESALPGFTNGGMYIPSDDGGELYALDSAGRHLRTVDSLTGALRWRFEYDDAKRLSAVVDGDGDTTRIERDGAGRPVAIVGPRGQRTTLVPDGAGRLGSIADPAGNTWRMGYDGGGLLKTFQDPRGGVSRMDYDGSGRLVRDANPEEGTKTLTRTETDSGVKVEVTTRLGRTTTYRDELLPGGARRRSVRAPSGAESVIVLRENGSRSLTRADGTTVASEAGADPRFGMALPTMARQVTTTPDGHRREVTTRLDARLDDTADPLSVSSLTEEVKVNGKAWIRDWTRATRTMRVDTPEGRRREIRFDEKGRVVYDRPDTRVEPMTIDYDEHGRVTRVTRGDRFVALTYAAGTDRPATRRDASGREWAYAYDAAERLVGIRMPSGARYGFGYDRAGALTSVTMPNGAVHAIGRDGLGRETSYTPPGSAPFTTELDHDGAMALARLPGGRTIDPDRDAAGRLERVVFPEAATGVEYDDAGRAKAITRTPGPRLELGYDGALIERLATDAGAFEWTFDDMQRPTGRKLTSGGDTVTTAFEYDGDSLPRKVGPFAIDRAGPGGAATALRDGTVLAQTWTYDSLGRTDVRTQTVGGRVPYKLDLGYDNAGRIATREETVDGVKRSYAYAYDLDGRVTEVRRDGAIVERYGYDANGNRTSARYGDDPAQAATYDGQDRLSSRAGIAHGSDTDGFVVARGADAFTYSAAGELMSATAGGRTVTYAYDALGRRVSRTEGGATERYLYGNPDDRFQVSAVRSAGGALSLLHYDDSGVLFAIERGGRRFYVGADQVGTPRVVTDDSGAVVKRLEYDTFGRLLADSAPEWELPIGFAGGIADRVTGLVRFGVRDYDPAAGRWTARDPIRFTGGQGNLYAYAGSDPVNYRDTNGMNRRCDCPVQTSLNELGDMAGFAAWGATASAAVGTEMAGMTAAGDAIFSLTVDRAVVEGVKTLSIRGVQGLGNGFVAAEIAGAEATIAAEMAAAQGARTAAMAAGAKAAGAFAAGVAAGLAFNRWWDCTYGKSFGESVYDWAARRGWVPE